MVHIRPSIPEKCPHDQDQLPFPQSRTTSPTALSNHKRAESIPCAGYQVHRPQAQRTNGHSWQLLRCSKHMAQASTKLQAHGKSKHQARSTWHAACLPRGEARCPHSAEYWQAGDMVMLRPCDRICKMGVQVKISAPSHVFSRRWTMESHSVSVRPDRIGVQCRTIDIVIPRQGSIGQPHTVRHILSSKNLDTLFLVVQVHTAQND